MSTLNLNKFQTYLVIGTDEAKLIHYDKSSSEWEAVDGISYSNVEDCIKKISSPTVTSTFNTDSKFIKTYYYNYVTDAVDPYDITENSISRNDFFDIINDFETHRIFRYIVNKEKKTNEIITWHLPIELTCDAGDDSIDVTVGCANDSDEQFWANVGWPNKKLNNVFLDYELNKEDSNVFTEYGYLSKNRKENRYPRLYIKSKTDTDDLYNVFYYTTEDSYTEFKLNNNKIYNIDGVCVYSNDFNKNRAPSQWRKSTDAFLTTYNFEIPQLNGDDWYVYEQSNVYVNEGEICALITGLDGTPTVTRYSSIDLDDVDGVSTISELLENLNGDEEEEETSTAVPETGTYIYINGESEQAIYKYTGTGNTYSSSAWEKVCDVYSSFDDISKINAGTLAAKENENGTYTIYKYNNGYWEQLNDNAYTNTVTQPTKIETSTTSTEILNSDAIETVDETVIHLLNDGRNVYALDLDNQNILLALNGTTISDRTLLHCKATLLYGNEEVSGVTYKILSNTSDTNYYDPEKNTVSINSTGTLSFTDGFQLLTDDGGAKTTYILIGATTDTLGESEEDDASNYQYKARLTLVPNSIQVTQIKGAITGYENKTAWEEAASTWISGHSPSTGDIYILDLNDNTDEYDGQAVLFTGSENYSYVGKIKGNDGKDGTGITYYESQPEPASINDVYKNSTTGKLMIYNGTKWVEMLAESANYWMTSNISNSISRSFPDSAYDDTGSIKSGADYSNATYNPGFISVTLNKQIGQNNVENVTSDVFSGNSSNGTFNAYYCTSSQTDNTTGVTASFSFTAGRTSAVLTLNPSDIKSTYTFIKLVWTTPLGGVEREDIPIVDVLKGATGAKGTDGLSGQVIRGPHAWNSQSAYYDGTTSVSGVKYLDTVYYSSHTYLCASTVVSTSGSNSTPDTDSTHWTQADEYKAIATELLLASTAKIGATTTGTLSIANDSDEVQAGMQKADMLASDSTKVDTSSVVIWAGAATPSSAPFMVTYGGNVTATNAVIAGTITATSGSIGGITITSNNGIAASNFAIDASGTFYGTDLWLGTKTAYSKSTTAGFAETNTSASNNEKSIHVTDDGIMLDNEDGNYTQTGIRGGNDADDIVFYAGKNKEASDDNDPSNCAFAVTLGGNLYAQNADITGKITATEGIFSGYVRMPFTEVSKLAPDVQFTDGNYVHTYRTANSFLGTFTSDPDSTAVDNNIYYNTVDSSYYKYNGSSWTSLTVSSSTTAISNNNVSNYLGDERSYLINKDNNKAVIVTIPNPSENLSGFTYHFITKPSTLTYADRNYTVASCGTIIRCDTLDSSGKYFVNYALAGLLGGESPQIASCGGHLELTCIGNAWAITQCTGEVVMMNADNTSETAYSPIYGYVTQTDVSNSKSPKLITKIWAGNGVDSSRADDTIYINTTV